MWTLLLGRFADEAGREEDAGTGGVMLTTTAATIPAYAHRRHPPHDGGGGSTRSLMLPTVQRPGRPSVLFVGTDGKQPAERNEGGEQSTYCVGDHDSRPASLSWNSMAPTYQTSTNGGLCCDVRPARQARDLLALNRAQINHHHRHPRITVRGRDMSP